MTRMKRTVRAAPVIAKRLAPGRMVVGPDHYGCCNTGMAPALFRSKFLHDHFRYRYKFAIGPEVFVEAAVRMLVFDKVPPGQAFVEFNGGRDRVTFAVTYKTARKRFDFLVAEITVANAAARAKHMALRTRAKAGDMAAVLGLVDY